MMALARVMLDPCAQAAKDREVVPILRHTPFLFELPAEFAQGT
jgi:hypothetical protein